jgi:hypothetical protein
MRAAAVSPAIREADPPAVYRLWRSCERHNVLWWAGGLANQPKFLMMEFEACRRGLDSHTGYEESIIKAIKAYQDATGSA